MQKIYALLIATLFLFGCNSNFTIKGKIDNMPTQKFRVEELGISANNPVDSGTTAADGSFSLSHSIKEEALYRIKFEKGKYILLALSPNDKVDIAGDWNLLENYQITGSKSSTALKSFLVNLRENIKDIRTLQMIIDTMKTHPKEDSLVKEAEIDLRKINVHFIDYVKKYADTTQSVACALFAANIINPKMEGPYVISFYQNIVKRFPSSNIAKQFAERALSKTPTAAPNNSTKKIAPDFTATTPDGQSIALSNYKGKYILLDFWASWCGPCRKENPNVVAAYNQFKDKNFMIIGMSLDEEKENWQKAIQKDGLVWMQVSELKGWSSVAARNYGVESIPTNFLIDPQGNIVASNLRGEQLMNTLGELLK